MIHDGSLARVAHYTCLTTSILGALWTTPSQAVTELRIAAQEASSPKFVLRRQDGRMIVDGLCVDIMHAIERIEPELKFVFDPEPQSLARLEAGLQTGKLQTACGFLWTEERKFSLHYVEPPLFRTDFYVAVRANDDIHVRNWDDIRRLGDHGVILGEAACNNVLQAVTGLKTDFSAKDPKTNIQKLLAGRGRFFFHRSPGIEDAIRDAGAQDKVKVLPVVLETKPLYMVLSNTVPLHVAEKMQQAIERLQTNGDLKKLLNKWSGD